MREPSKEEMIDLLKDVFGLVKVLMTESERASVILASARMDVDLERLLKHLLLPYPGDSDPMFDGDRMLGTFSAKIAMTHRLGAIDNDLEHALQLVRKIRNDFAHDLEVESLSSQKQKGRLAELVRWAISSEMYQSGLKVMVSDGKSSEQAQFVACAICIIVTLHSGLRLLSRVNVHGPLSL